MDLKTLTAFNAPSGCERALRKAIYEEAKTLCADVSVDRMGNVVARKARPGAKRVLLCAHMDEVGLIVTGATDEGLLKIRAVGGIDPRVLVSKRVLVGEEQTPGVIGAMAIHLQGPEDRKRVLPIRELYIDTGAKDKAEAEKLAPAGTYAFFDTPYTPYGENMVCAKALDDRVGCYNLLRLMAHEYPCDVTFAFVNQEEVGLRGAHTVAFDLAPDEALVLEGTSANDLGDVPPTSQVCRVGAGVCVSFMDNASIANRELYRRVTAVAAQSALAFQIKRGVTGGNDAGALQRTGGGAATCVLSVPCRYIHSPASAASLSDIDAQYALCKAYLQYKEE